MSKRTIEILNALSTALGDASDYEVAQHLGVTRATVSKWRTGTGTMGDETALRAASFIEQETPEALLAEMAGERADSPRAREAYRRIAAKLRGAAVVIMAVGAGITGISSEGRTQSIDTITVYYGKLKI